MQRSSTLQSNNKEEKAKASSLSYSPLPRKSLICLEVKLRNYDRHITPKKEEVRARKEEVAPIR